jgi:Holliday junction resolvasome RuvABC endonuclease subunit
MILGLDISTSSTGWAIIDSDGKYVDMGSFKLSKHDNVFDKATIVKEGLQELKSKYSIDMISIEEPLQSFRRGFSSAHVLLTLARFNGIVSWLAFEIFGLKPNYFDFKSARKILGIKIDKTRDVKDQIMEWVESSARLTLPRREAKVGKKKGQMLFAAGVNDAADAYVMARTIYLSKLGK